MHAVLVTATACCAVAQEPAATRGRVVANAAQQTQRGFGVVVEEDLPQFSPFGRNQDRNYTGGLGFMFGGDYVFNRPLAWLGRVFERHVLRTDAWIPQGERLVEAELTSVGVTAFTPDSLFKSTIERGDRPYASLTQATHRRLLVMARERIAYTSEVTVGMLGLHLARNGQRWIHKQSRAGSGKATPYDPKGWSHQISDGGEPTALVSFGAERLVVAFGDEGGRHWMDLTHKLVGNAGYYTDGALGLQGRLGLLNAPFWTFGPSALANASRANPAMSGDSARRRGADLFVFAQGRGRVSAYNALLQGQLCTTDYTVESYRRVTGEWDLGVAARIPVGKQDLRFTWSLQSGRTSEIKGDFGRTHTWGSIAVAVTAPLRY